MSVVNPSINTADILSRLCKEGLAIEIGGWISDTKHLVHYVELKILRTPPPAPSTCLTGRRRSRWTPPQESSSLSSSYGSPGSDLAELRHLKTQFGQQVIFPNNLDLNSGLIFYFQEQLLGQLRNALQGNSDRLASKEQEVQVYLEQLLPMIPNRKLPGVKYG